MKEDKNKLQKYKKGLIFITILFGILISSIFFLSAANPVGPTNVVSVSNETHTSTTSAAFFNISGGYIAALNLTARFTECSLESICWMG